MGEKNKSPSHGQFSIDIYICSTKNILCLRGYDKKSKTYKDIWISQYYTVFIFILIDATFGFVAPIAASKINVKVDWSSHHFSQNFNIRIKHGFSCINVHRVSREMLKTEGDRSGGYSGKLDEPIVHGWGVDACCPAFPLPEPVQVTSLGWHRQNISRQNQQNFFHQNNAVRIDWPVPSSDISTIEHVKECFGQRVRRITLAPRNLQALNAALQKESRLTPRYQKHQNYSEYVKPVLICGWLGTHSLLKAFSSFQPDI